MSAGTDLIARSARENAFTTELLDDDDIAPSTARLIEFQNEELNN